MKQILSLFYDYYHYQTTETASNLLEAISKYDDLDLIDSQLIDQRPIVKDKENNVYLASSGTTGPFKRYPVHIGWITRIEKLIKNPNNQKVIYIQDSFDFASGEYLEQKLFGTTLKNYLFSCSSIIHPKHIYWAIDFIKSLNEKNLILYAYPSFHLRYLKILKEQSLDISIISTDYDAFFKTYGYHVNDNMIDWYTGLNFYTCPYGKKHFLPIFSIKDGWICNLINLSAQPVPVSDHFRITGEPMPCLCGKKYVPFEFIPHISAAINKNGKYYYDLDLINHLESDLHSIQFIQEENTILVAYRGNMTLVDKNFLNDWWREKSFDVNFLPYSYLRTASSHKLATFFNNTYLRKPIQQVKQVKLI